MINWEKLTIEQTFDSGIYHVFAKSYWKTDVEYNLVISSYSDYINDIVDLRLDEIPCDWLSLILSDMGKKIDNRLYPSRDEPDSYASNVMFDNNNFSGFCFFYYENCSKDGEMCVNIAFKNLKGFKILNLKQLLSLKGSELKDINGKISDNDYSNSNLVIRIPRLSTIVVILQVVNLPWICSLDWYQDIWFEYSVETMISKMQIKEYSDSIEMDSRGLKLSEMEHNRGVIIFIENLFSYDFKVVFDITLIKNLVLKDNEEVFASEDGKKLEFIVKRKGMIILNYAIIRSVKEYPMKLRYIYQCEKVE